MGMINITIDTTSLSGTSAALAFDLLRGDAASNSVSILDFTTDGALGGGYVLGGASGALPDTVTIQDVDFFNEFLQDIVLANSISFTLSFTENFLAPTPTAFSLFMLDTQGLSLFETSDPTGASALFALDIDGTEFGNYSVFAPLAGGATLTATPFTPPDPIPVPEPGSPALLLVAVAVFAALVSRPRR